jgi:hypothetical protein
MEMSKYTFGRCFDDEDPMSNSMIFMIFLYQITRLSWKFKKSRGEIAHNSDLESPIPGKVNFLDLEGKFEVVDDGLCCCLQRFECKSLIEVGVSIKMVEVLGGDFLDVGDHLLAEDCLPLLVFEEAEQIEIFVCATVVSCLARRTVSAGPLRAGWVSKDKPMGADCVEDCCVCDDGADCVTVGVPAGIGPVAETHITSFSPFQHIVHEWQISSVWVLVVDEADRLGPWTYQAVEFAETCGGVPRLVGGFFLGRTVEVVHQQEYISIGIDPSPWGFDLIAKRDCQRFSFVVGDQAGAAFISKDKFQFGSYSVEICDCLRQENQGHFIGSRVDQDVLVHTQLPHQLSEIVSLCDVEPVEGVVIESYVQFLEQGMS